MKNKTLFTILVCLSGSLLISTGVLAYKYQQVKKAFQRESKAKVWYCKHYWQLKCSVDGKD